MSIVYRNVTGSNGTTTMTADDAPGTTWLLTSCSVSMAGPAIGPNARVDIWDGAVGTGTLIHREYMPGPGALAAGVSVGTTHELKLPLDPQGRRGIQATPGNEMNIQVVGTGPNQVSINGRFHDGLV